MTTFDVIIRDGSFVTPGGIFKGDMGINEGKIHSLSSSSLSNADKVINAEGDYVFPGVIDPHLHLTKEFDRICARETESLAFGGITSAFNFVQSRDRLSQVLDSMIETTANKSAINLGFHAIIANLDQVSQIPIFSESLGVTSFKFLMAAQERELYPDTFAASDGTMFLAFDQIAKLGYPATAMVHAENWEICFALKEKFITEGRARSQEDYIESRPRICETEAISRCLRLSRYFNSRLYFPHVSTAEGVDLISRSRWGGLKVAGETCPHYLAFTKNNKFPLPAKVNPPLRESQDIEALWGGLLNGAITCVASDYVPGNSGRLDPDNVFDSAGMPGRTPGIILPFLLTEVSRGRLTPEQVARVTSANIAKWFGVFPQKGCLWLGSDADLTIVDTKISKRINPHTLHATTDLTWYDGLDVNGWPIRTMINGLTVTEFDQFHGENTKGSYLRRKLGVPSC